MHRSTNAKVTIQIVGWNSEKHLAKAVVPLANAPEYVHVRYIDNGSEDDSVSVVEQSLPHADIMRMHENIGFAPAHNMGFDRCTTPYVLIHDPDVVLDFEGLAELVRYMDEHRDVGAVQGKLMRPDRQTIDSAGIALTWTFNGREVAAGESDAGQANRVREVDGVTGACGLYRIESLNDIPHQSNDGPLEIFDADFFAYKEDVDLGWRLTNAGWRCMYIPTVIGTHNRTLGIRGRIPWYVNPVAIVSRMASARTRYSIRNYAWMVVKNASVFELMTRGWLVVGRLLVYAPVTVVYPPHIVVWWEILRGMPKMWRKRV